MVVIGLVVPISLKMTLDLRSKAAGSKNLTMIFCFCESMAFVGVRFVRASLYFAYFWWILAVW